MKNITAVNERETEASDFVTPLAILPNDANLENLRVAKKIVPLEKIGHELSALRLNKKVVQCHGVFDLLHIGHIKHLHQAKNFGDILVVTITADKFVNKGPGRPYFSEYLRAEALASLSCVDYVVINHHPTAIEAIKVIRPDLYVKGIEYQEVEKDITGKISEEEEAVKSIGGQLNFTKDIVFSSSALLNRFFSPFSQEVIAYLDQFKGKYHVNDILKYFEGAKNLKVLLIGEAIVDIYHYGEAIGKSGKEPILVTKYHREEIYIGGVLAIANHLSSFCSEVTCVTMLGEKGEYESFIRENLKENVNIVFHYKKESPTIVKRRYIEEYSSQKLFEIYEIDDCYFNDEQKQFFTDSIEDQLAKHDVVIVADYGHGLLDSGSIAKIEEKAKFLAVNTQANASNHGFNCISKYNKADYVCIANRELQLNFRQKHISSIDQIKQLMSEHDYKNVVVTSGVSGSFSCKQGEDIYITPAFATSIKDRVGAGDAVLAVTSLFVAQQAPADMVGFIGNVVGSEAVNIMGNKSFIEKVPLMKHIVHLMK
ncbi:PfkB family carbohydrate kinase [Aquicella lusitana]|uniref:RfaE bifunctional protein kinase chain/domain/rfaE bifunctional protein nucleotidyltransferase chain/domain n=1 Tax=Aquicella lusitana TaxID=254246 RepID=A0A370GRM4_9COXI|nr:PfkB family carbohydrate kinase [Aquicella lusitana]RDI45134.1 rfaE bifunctional protein kinase chain/domain/rfaE bifunctional protein nucleotidyltransferase chain/domain [Aquicella lusitana]VVC72796.1 D-beta-D-heptose 1-phosphate adenylyltransferase [Aquicella lusitana]